MVERVREEVASPLCHHDCYHDEEQLMDVIRYFNHDHRQRHCQTGYTRKKRDGPEEREGPRVHPGPVFASLYAELIDEKATDHSAVDSTDEQHGYDNPTGDGGAGCPTGHDKVD